jgi:hypothetical protein
MRLPAVSDVASQSSIPTFHRAGASAHRHAAADSKQQPSSPFAALVDDPDSQSPAPTDRQDPTQAPPQSRATAASTNDAQADKSAKPAQNTPVTVKAADPARAPTFRRPSTQPSTRLPSPM